MIHHHRKTSSSLLVLSLFLLYTSSVVVGGRGGVFSEYVASAASNTTFPAGFAWGTATASYQVEGGWLEGGRGLTIWDAFSHTPNRVLNNETGDVADDHFHLWKSDIELMKSMGLKNYRMSIAWSRILPAGTGNPNPAGIAFYNSLIDGLVAAGITPWVTLYHWDLPLALQMEQNGWLNSNISNIFANYAKVCFETFGDRVKHWITINEPWCVSVLGHETGVFAPGHTLALGVEAYTVTHNIILAHAKAVNVYRTLFKPTQKGVIGITLNNDWKIPRTQAQADIDAQNRALEFFCGWFADPIYFGDYPQSMRRLVGSRLPNFTAAEVALVKGSNDFFGLNHYTTQLVFNVPPQPNAPSWTNDQNVGEAMDPSWNTTLNGWAIVPMGLYNILKYIHNRYHGPIIYLTENGCAQDGSTNPLEDTKRIDFLRAYMTAAHQAISEGVHLEGYFVWSLMDNFEWASGYGTRFGIHHVDYSTLARTPKASATWFTQVMKRNDPNFDKEE